MPRYGIVNRLNLCVVVAEAESSATWNLIDDWQHEDDSPYADASPPFFDRRHIERIMAACSEEDECGCGCDLRCLLDKTSDCICRACAVCSLCECCCDKNHAYTDCFSGDKRGLQMHSSRNINPATRCERCDRAVKTVYSLQWLCAACWLKSVRGTI